MEELSIDEENAMRQTSSSLTASQDELRELCFLLDKERQKMSELVEQWKVFSATARDKLTSQIVDYQEKLIELEQRQELLLKGNDSLRLIIHQMITNSNKKHKQSQTDVINYPASFQRSNPIYDHLSRIKVTIEPEFSLNSPFDDQLQQQISIENIFDAIKTVEIYQTTQCLTHQSEKTLLKQFCALVWNYLEDRSKPKSSCLL
ncbi:unnamed protein product [Adineta ricciae]|uniref:Uncharacterized protein n=1 Tax=Adineta ricciae TaxID=249248 RepID=A0A816EVU8_ADIRI|nr:unnamed protein product [Adineta ricciae]CAF1651204.1 unnamed protein product [Adineta ricciae]